MAIADAVGEGARNAPDDVRRVQHLLNAWAAATMRPLLVVDGRCGARTLAAIRDYQAQVVRLGEPDGRVDPGGRTWTALAAGLGSAVPLSGAAWWHAHQARFPNSAAIADLAEPFRTRAAAFVGALREAGARVAIASTRRNAVRAKLMAYSWRIASAALDPGAVPAIPGVAIRWDHGDDTRSRRAAQEMVALFGIAYPPALTSRHIAGRAIDMTINWSGTLALVDAVGARHRLEAPRSGAGNTALHAIGAGYGVHKLLSDPPHWSDDGR